METDLSWLKTTRKRKPTSVDFNFKDFMLNNGVSDRDLALKLGITENAVYGMIKRGTLKISYLEKLPGSKNYVIKNKY